MCAGVVKLADATDSKSVGSDTVPVRVRPPAPTDKPRPRSGFVSLLGILLFPKLKYTDFSALSITFISPNYGTVAIIPTTTPTTRFTCRFAIYC